MVLCVLADHGLAVSPPSEPKPKSDFTNEVAHRVLRVIDGDTVELLLNGFPTTVRLIGVDTPETVHPKRPVEYYGQEASTFAKNLLRGDSVYVEYETGSPETDKYRRLLAYLYRAPDGLFVNLEIIRQGYGHAYTRFPFKYMELFRAHEQAARSAGKGLWGRVVLPGTGEVPPAPPMAEQVESSSPASDTKTITVYVTATGKKYHREGCRYLSRSRIAKALEEAKAGYTACKVCKPPR